MMLKLNILLQHFVNKSMITVLQRGDVHIVWERTELLQSIHYLLLIHGRVTEATGPGVKPRHPSPQQHSPAPPGGSEGLVLGGVLPLGQRWVSASGGGVWDLWILFTSDDKLEQEMGRRIGASSALMITVPVGWRGRWAKRRSFLFSDFIFISTLTYGYRSG